jgi:hypothetical protein
MRFVTKPFAAAIVIGAFALRELVQPAFAGEFALQPDEFFEKRIRPLLVEHCYQCHSAESQELMGELRLDLKAGWQLGGESGKPAIVPGNPDESPLIRAVRHDNDVSAMPPNKPQLSDQSVADLIEWVRIGAPDSRAGTVARDKNARWDAEFRQRLDWWSLQPLKDVALPEVAGDWPRDAVDHFILARLEQQDLRPAPDADGLTLLRRMSFVLTGLPPTAELVKSFPALFDENPDAALETLVNELLNSPHFGERIARHWMDVVRYTDTYGYEWDNPAKGSWEYRDYLIRAFNQDIGFDQLIREQIAGDLLATPRVDSTSGFVESLIGPMFYHLGEHRHGDNEVINGVREEMIDNKIDAFSKAFLAMTIACARCHDHKLDAISQKDYYALAGMFMTPRWTSRPIDAPEKNAAKIAELRALRTAIHQRTAALWLQQTKSLVTGKGLRQAAAKFDRAEMAQAQVGQIEWLLHLLLPQPSHTLWQTSSQLSANASQRETELIVEEDGSILATGEVPATDVYTVTFKTEAGSVDQIRLEALTHQTLGNNGPGRTPHGNFVLSHLRLSVKPLLVTTDDSGEMLILGEPQSIEIASAEADYEQPNYPVAAALNPTGTSGWGVGLGGNVDRVARFRFAKPLELPHGGEWTVTLEQQFGSQHTLGRFRLSVGADAPLSSSESDELVSDKAIAAAWQELVSQWQTVSDQRKTANAKFHTLTDFSGPELPPGFVAEGDGMLTGYASGGEPLVALAGDIAIEHLLPRGYHTHAISSKLPGALRLPHQEDLPGTQVSVALAGDQWSGFLRISDNSFQTENVTFLKRKQPAWQTFSKISTHNGIQRVAYEIVTSDLNPNFPPRTGVASAGGVTLPPQDDGFDKRSWFSVTGIVSHHESGQPLDDLRNLESLLIGEPPTDAERAWKRVGQWLASSVQRYNAGPLGDGDVELLNWMLRRGLLTNRLADDAELASLVLRYRQVEDSLPFPRACNSMDERELMAIDYALNVRGDINRRGDPVPRGLPTFTSHVGTADFQSVDPQQQRQTGSLSYDLPVATHNLPVAMDSRESAGYKPALHASGRAELAEFLTDAGHGMAARVYVNRVWQWVFGESLVRSPDDFGHLGDQPSHPELLDYLARQFIADGWSTKRLIQRLVLSRTFRQSGLVTAEAMNADPYNRWLHHYPTRRLEAESIRDALLAVAQRLDPTLYGRPIRPPRQVEDPAKRLFSGPLDGHGRRSIYLQVSIMDRSKFLQSFNAPDPKLPSGRRDETNAPAQALAMLNDPLVLAMADQWSSRLIADASPSVEHRIESMFFQALGRAPYDEELTDWTALVKCFSTGDNILENLDAWRHSAHTMFNLQEFTHYR